VNKIHKIYYWNSWRGISTDRQTSALSLKAALLEWNIVSLMDDSYTALVGYYSGENHVKISATV